MLLGYAFVSHFASSCCCLLLRYVGFLVRETSQRLTTYNCRPALQRSVTNLLALLGNSTRLLTVHCSVRKQCDADRLSEPSGHIPATSEVLETEPNRTTESRETASPEED